LAAVPQNDDVKTVAEMVGPITFRWLLALPAVHALGLGAS